MSSITKTNLLTISVQKYYSRVNGRDLWNSLIHFDLQENLIKFGSCWTGCCFCKRINPFNFHTSISQAYLAISLYRKSNYVINYFEDSIISLAQSMQRRQVCCH